MQSSHLQFILISISEKQHTWKS